MSPILEGYEEKAPSYFEYERAEMLEMIPDHACRVLDAGCGSGRFGRLVKQERRAEVWGVELSPRACKEAENCLDRVVNAEFGESLALPKRAFHMVVFNDVLEHMVNPWAVSVRRAKGLSFEETKPCHIYFLSRISNLNSINEPLDDPSSSVFMRVRTAHS